MVARLLLFVLGVSAANAAFSNCPWVNSLDCVTYTPGVVCASDGKDYPNKCYLAKDQCLDNNLHLKYEGTCASHGYTGGATAAPGVTTASPAPGSGTTRDPVFINHNQLLDFFCLELMHKACPTNTEMVCGTDGVTYDNICEYEKARCGHRALAVNHFGMC